MIAISVNRYFHMKSNKLVTGGLAVGAVVLVKLALKTAFIASIFGATYGGVSYAKTEYEMSVEHIKQDLADTTRQKGGQFIHEGVRFDRAYVDDLSKTAVFEYTYSEIDNATYQKALQINAGEVQQGFAQDRAYSVKHLKQEADFRTVFEHDWKVEYRYKTSDGLTVEDYTISRDDVLPPNS